VSAGKWFLWLRRVLAIVAGLYLANIFVRNGWRKFDSGGFWSAPFERWGYPPWLRILVGVIETGGGIGLVIPWVAPYAGVGLFVVMAGAFYTRWGAGYPQDLMWIAIYGFASLWIAFEWRGFALFRGKPANTNSDKA
jgi:uncharacterized membrane protein YphA (DoxX/SURF4 family)